MVFPIVAFGHPNLRKIAVDIDKDYPDLDNLIESMYESMYISNGVGLAAPQINKSIRLFTIDATPFSEEAATEIEFKEVFINAKMIEESGDKWPFAEGCLSVPGINEDVMRSPNIRIQYYDANWEFQDKEFDGVIARVIQHEYDHLEGKLFVDHLSGLRKTMLKGKLNDISKGKVKVDYRMIFPKLKKKR
ncbi:MAG: peptide deformylase [Bacteroidales bacterium]|nr:peptide deformylase [Bacteroidales bacterium]